MLLQKNHIIGRPLRWKAKDADWGLWASKIPDSTLESSNSATELNDLKKRIEQASTTVLGKTSVPFIRRKTPWLNGLYRNAVLERRKARNLLKKIPSMSNLKACQERYKYCC